MKKEFIITVNGRPFFAALLEETINPVANDLQQRFPDGTVSVDVVTTDSYEFGSADNGK